MKFVYECSACGSTDVQIAVIKWIKPNTNEDVSEGEEVQATWCECCETDTGPLARREADGGLVLPPE